MIRVSIQITPGLEINRCWHSVNFDNWANICPASASSESCCSNSGCRRRRGRPHWRPSKVLDPNISSLDHSVPGGTSIATSTGTIDVEDPPNGDAFCLSWTTSSGISESQLGSSSSSSSLLLLFLPWPDAAEG